MSVNLITVLLPLKGALSVYAAILNGVNIQALIKEIIITVTCLFMKHQKII